MGFFSTGSDCSGGWGCDCEGSGERGAGRVEEEEEEEGGGFWEEVEVEVGRVEEEEEEEEGGSCWDRCCWSWTWRAFSTRAPMKVLV